jgi:transposase
MKRQGNRYQKFDVKLSRKDRRKVNKLLAEEKESVRVFRRLLVLHLLDRGRHVGEVGEDVKLSSRSVRYIGNRYLGEGLKRALYDSPRPGKQALLSDHQEKEVIALVCSSPPRQRARWTLELLREEVIRHGIIPAVSRDTLRRLLRDCQVKPWLEKNVVHWGSDRRIHRENGGYSRSLREEI